MCVGGNCKSFWHMPSYRDAVRTAVRMRRTIDKFATKLNLGVWGALFNNRVVMLLGAAGLAFLMGGTVSVIVLGVAGLALLPHITASEFGCTLDFTRKVANCGRGLFVTNEQWTNRYGISIRDGDKLAGYLFSKSNETDMLCVECYTKLQ